MKQDNLNKDVYENIHISDDMVDSMITDLNSGKRRSDMRFRYSTAILALIIVGVVGFGSIGAGAAYISYKNRLEEMTEQEQADYVQEWTEDDYNTVDESMTRSLTKEEDMRYLELEDEYYKNAVFPENILPHVKTLDEITEDELAFVEEINKIHIPDGELTDEQLLQLIDHEAKYLYTIEQNLEEMSQEPSSADEEVEEYSFNEEEDEFSFNEEDVYANFDVTPEEEQSAKELSISLIKKIYDVDIDDSWNIDIYGIDWSEAGELNEAWVCYEVTITESDAPRATMYQLSLPKNPGGLFSINCSGKKYYNDDTEYTKEEAEPFVEEGQQAALKCVREVFGLGTPDRIEIGKSMNGLGEEVPSSNIAYYLYYGEDAVIVIWNINNKQIYFVEGEGIL